MASSLAEVLVVLMLEAAVMNVLKTADNFDAADPPFAAASVLAVSSAADATQKLMVLQL
jgi:hypothetical protein